MKYTRFLASLLAALTLAGAVLTMASCDSLFTPFEPPRADGTAAPAESETESEAPTRAETESASLPDSGMTEDTEAVTARPEAPTDKPGDETTADTTKPNSPPSLPSDEELGATTHAYEQMDKKKFNRDFVILTREGLVEDVRVDTLTADLLDDTIFEQNKAIKADFGVEYICRTMEGYLEINEMLSQQMSSGLDDYDLYVGHKFSMASCVMNGSCYDLNRIETLRPDQPWWDASCYENLTVSGKTGLLTGYIFPTAKSISSCLLVNRSLAAERGRSPEALYEHMKNGTWTLDVLREYTEDMWGDFNGNEVPDSDDRFGLTSWMMDGGYSFYYGAAEPFVTLADGEPAIASTDHMADVYAKIAAIITKNAFFVTEGESYTDGYQVFAESRALFCEMTLSKIPVFVLGFGMKDDFGILPMPKYEAEQDDYRTFVNGAAPFAMVCGSEQDPAFVGTMMEAMATYNYDHVRPHLFESLTRRTAEQDPDSHIAMQIILRTGVYDLAYYHDLSLGNLPFQNLVNGSATLSESAIKTAQRIDARQLLKIARTYAQWASMDN